MFIRSLQYYLFATLLLIFSFITTNFAQQSSNALSYSPSTNKISSNNKNTQANSIFQPLSNDFNDPTKNYDNIENHWSEVIMQKTDYLSIDPYTPTQTDNFVDFTGSVRVRYGADLSFDKITFTNKPTLSAIFPGGKAFQPVLPNPAFDSDGNPLPPIGLRYPTAFDSEATRFNSFFEFGTEGLFWEKLSTFCSGVQKRTIFDLTDASPFQNLLQTYGSLTGIPGNIEGAGRYQLVNAYGRISNLGKENYKVGIKFGRQFSDFTEYLTSPTAFDGAAINFQLPRTKANFYIGSRHSFFADPVDKFVIGGSLSAKLPFDLEFDYSVNDYISTKQLFKVSRNLFGFSTSTYLTLKDDIPVDVGATISKFSFDGRGYIRLSFNRKLTDKDFVFDQFLSNKYKGFLVDKIFPIEKIRLFLRPPRRSNDYAIYGEYFVKPWLGIGGEVHTHRLKEDVKEAFDPLTNSTVILSRATAFDAPYTDLSTFIELIPNRSQSVFSPRVNLEFRQRTLIRPDFAPVTFMADLQAIGETRYREFVLQSLLFTGKKWSVDFNMQRRSYNFRNRTQNRLFTRLTASSAIAFSSSLSYRFNQYSTTYFTYSFDTDFSEFNPDIKNAHQLRISYRVQF